MAPARPICISRCHSGLYGITRKKGPVKKLDISPWLKDTRLNTRQKKAIKYLSKNRNISNAIYQRLCDVSKPTATRDLQELVRLNIITPPATRDAGALYFLCSGNRR